MADYDLSKEIGDLLRLEREKRGLTQQKFAAETTTTQQRLSRIDRGTTPATTVAVQRLFEALGLRVRVTAVPLEADLDDQIDRLAATSDAERLELLELYEFVLNTLSAAPFVYSGRMGAYLQGAPVPVSVFELAIADADLDSFGEA